MKWKEKIAILTIIRKVEDRIEILNTAGFNQLKMNVYVLLIIHFNKNLRITNYHIKTLEKRI
jgi:hypothetical protein